MAHFDIVQLPGVQESDYDFEFEAAYFSGTYWQAPPPICSIYSRRLPGTARIPGRLPEFILSESFMRLYP